MRNKAIEKANRSKSAGAAFPNKHEIMQKLRYWFKSRLSNKQLLILLIMWLKGQLNELDESQEIPCFYRMTVSQTAEINAFRIMREGGGIPWVEYSIKLKEGEYIWMPVPRVFKTFFWRVLQTHSKYDKPILNEQERDELYVYTLKPTTCGWFFCLFPPVK